MTEHSNPIASLDKKYFILSFPQLLILFSIGPSNLIHDSVSRHYTSTSRVVLGILKPKTPSSWILGARIYSPLEKPFDPKISGPLLSYFLISQLNLTTQVDPIGNGQTTLTRDLGAFLLLLKE